MKVIVEIVKQAIITIPDSWLKTHGRELLSEKLCAKADELSETDFKSDGGGYEFYDTNGNEII